MLGLGSIVKIAKGGLAGLDKDQIEELLEQAGIEGNISALESGQIPWTFEQLSEHAAELGTKTALVAMKMKDGSRVSAVVVLIPPPKIVSLPS